VGCTKVQIPYPTQRIPGLLLVFTGHARAFCANFSILRKSRLSVNLISRILSITGRKVELKTKTAQILKTTGRPETESRSSKLLIPQSLWLWVLPCSGLGLCRLAYSSYDRDQTLGLRSDLPSMLTESSQVGSGAKLVNLLPA